MTQPTPEPTPEPVPQQTPSSWEQEVAYPDTGAYAYRPGVILIPDATDNGRLAPPMAEMLRAILRDLLGLPEDDDHEIDFDRVVEDVVAGYAVVRIDRATNRPSDLPSTALPDPLPLVEELQARGVDAQLDHLLFADQTGRGLFADALGGDPLSGNPLSGNPLSGNPLSGNPYVQALLFGDLFDRLVALGYPLPTPALAGPRGRAYARTGRGRNIARPAPSPWGHHIALTSTELAQVTILDVPLPSGRLPSVLSKCQPPTGTYGLPDGDGDDFLDRVAGHGLLVAGVVAQTYPQCPMQVVPVMDNLGYVSETKVAEVLGRLAGQTDIVNMSFSGYALRHMGCLARAVRRFQLTPGPASAGRPRSRLDGGVVVSSAGNDGSWQAPYPAALPGVVSVAALGPYGPAPFTNRGSWVRASAAGLDVLTTFFTPESWGTAVGGQSNQGKEPPGPDGDPDFFDGAAIVSGTSFAAPLVAGRLGQLVKGREMLPKEAVRHLLDAPGLAALPWLGTIVTA